MKAATTIYIGDAAAMGTDVAAGDGFVRYDLPSLTLAFAQQGTIYTNTSGTTQKFRISEVNFFQAATGTPSAFLTPFIAIYSGGQTAEDVRDSYNYSVIQIGSPIEATAETDDTLRNITISESPTFTVANGESLVAGYYSTGGSADLVQQSSDETDLTDFIAKENLLPDSLPAPLTGDGEFTLDRQQRFNIGLVP